MGRGLWVVGCGLWVVGCGLWVVGYGLWVGMYKLVMVYPTNVPITGKPTTNNQQPKTYNHIIKKKTDPLCFYRLSVNLIIRCA